MCILVMVFVLAHQYFISFYSYFKLCFKKLNLNSRDTEKMRQRKQYVPDLGSLARYLQWPKLGQTKTKNGGLPSGSTLCVCVCVVVVVVAICSFGCLFFPSY